MATISQQLTELVNQKNALATNLNTMGVTASTDETLNTLVPKVLDIETGGGGSSGGQYLVQVIDYDGTVLKSANLDTGATFTLPNAPTHEKLIFQEWSSPVTISNNSITVVDSDITIGATYKTASGLTEFDITLTKVTGLTVTCNINGNKNWGDGTEDSLTTHTYLNYGDYTITCDGTILSFYIFGQSTSINNYYCTSVRIGELVTNIASNAFRNCQSINSVTIPNSVISIGAYAFYMCYSLISIIIPDGITAITNYSLQLCTNLTSITIPKSVTSIGIRGISNSPKLKNITIPEGVTSIGDSAFYNNYSLASITIPASVTSIGSQAFNGCFSLTSITIPEGMTEFESFVFYNCTGLTSIIVPKGVTSIGNNAFSYCYIVKKYDFTSATAVPTLNNTSVFSGINDICKIVVPDTLYDEWISATNWVTYADYIYKASEYTE